MKLELKLMRAIECKTPFGHDAEPWRAWNKLFEVELMSKNVSALEAARQKAIQSYLAYRVAGGPSQSPVADLFALMAQALRQRQPELVIPDLEKLSSPDTSPSLRLLGYCLLGILSGRDITQYFKDLRLPYITVAELQLLLDQKPSPEKRSWFTKLFKG